MGEIVKAKFMQVQISDDLIVKNLKYLMRTKNLTEAGLSRNTGVAQPTLHKILSGRTNDPRVSTVKILANYFGITMDDLCTSMCVASEQAPPKGKYIPILSWDNCVTQVEKIYGSRLNKDDKLLHVTEPDAEYALISKYSMYPRFVQGSYLIIANGRFFQDGDYVVVHYKNTDEATIRRILVDGPVKKLIALNNDGSNYGDVLDNEVKILGTLIQTRVDYGSVGLRGLL